MTAEPAATATAPAAAPKPRHDVEIRYNDPDRPDHIDEIVAGHTSSDDPDRLLVHVEQLDENVYWMSVGDYVFHFVAHPASYRKHGRTHIELTWDDTDAPAGDVPSPTIAKRPQPGARP